MTKIHIKWVKRARMWLRSEVWLDEHKKQQQKQSWHDTKEQAEKAI